MSLIAQIEEVSLHPTCEHPEGCTKPKHFIRYYQKKGGAVSLHYRKYCKPHCNRLGRNGELGSVGINPKAKTGEGHITASGYRAFHKPDHPLSTPYGKVYEHRMVLYDKIGPGKHKCNWCDSDLDWGSTLFVDHLDFDKLNNDITNLVPSCSSCNVKRFNKLIRYILNNNIISQEILSCLH